MKSPGFLVAERALAQHSEKLSAPAVTPKELSGTLAEALPQLQDALADELSGLTGNTRPQIAIGKVERLAAAKVHRLIEPVGVHMLLGMRGAGEVLVSLGRPAALALTDQMFGGAGAVPATLPDRLPAAANLTMVRLGEALGRALGTAFDRPAALALARRDEVLGKLLPAREEEMLHLLRCEVEVGESAPWQVNLIVRESEIERLLASAESATARRAHGDRRRPDSAPFADMPMLLTAVLAELKVPIARLSTLKPGDTLPLPLRADVPLRLGGVEIARAQPGSDNGQLALRLTAIAWNERNANND